MELMFESQQRKLSEGTNIPANIRKKFMVKLHLIRDKSPYTGWTREAQEEPQPEFSRIDVEKLEDDVIEEMVVRRQSKAK
jgi:hypothetical protein